MNVWLDDTRDPTKHGHIGWEWVTSVTECIALLESGAVEVLSLDHDLDPQAAIGLPPTQPTGADVLRWMIAHPDIACDRIELHSDNPEGMRTMRALVGEWHRAVRASCAGRAA